MRCCMQELLLVSIWEAKRIQKRHIMNHSHKYHELVYYVFGSGETEIGGKAFQFSDRCFAVIPRHTEHNETHRSDSEVICLEFSGACEMQPGFYTDPPRVIHKILKELLQEVKIQKYGYQDMLTVKLNELMLHISRSKNNPDATKNFEYIINYIRENFQERINFSDCAGQLNLSYDYFQHKFKALTGYSPRQFLIEQRLLAAEKMLLEGNFNCTEIAYRCGFCTSAQFSAMFRKRFGATPLQFKKKQKA